MPELMSMGLLKRLIGRLKMDRLQRTWNFIRRWSKMNMSLRRQMLRLMIMASFGIRLCRLVRGVILFYLKVVKLITWTFRQNSLLVLLHR